MPCWYKVEIKLENLEDDRWNREARKKLGLNLTGGLTSQQAGRVRIEAGKLKAASVMKALDPSSLITGMGVGSNELRIQIDI